MNSDFVCLMPFLMDRDADLACLAPAWRWKRGFLITMSFATTGSIVLTDGTSQWLVDDAHCTCNVNLRKLLSANKSHVREISLFISAIPNQVRNSQTSRFVVGSKPGKVKPRRQRGATVVTGGGGGHVVAQE